MCDQLKPLIVLKILASEKPSKTPRQLVTVQLFDKEGLPASAKKGIKVSNFKSCDSGNLFIFIDSNAEVFKSALSILSNSPELVFPNPLAHRHRQIQLRLRDRSVGQTF